MKEGSPIFSRKTQSMRQKMNGSGQNPICRIWVGSFDVGGQEKWASLQSGESLRYLPQVWLLDVLLWAFSTDGLRHPSAENPTNFVLSREHSQQPSLLGRNC